METQTPPYIVESNFPQFFKTLTRKSTSMPPYSEPIDLENPPFHPSSSRNHNSPYHPPQCDPSNAQISRKFKSTAHSVVIDLNDDDFGDNGEKGVAVLDDNDDDDDCVFVKREKNLTPRGNHKKDPICVEEFETVNPKPGKNKAIGVDDYDDGNDEIRIINEMPSSSVSSRKKRKPFSGPSITEKGESSGSKKDIVDDDVVEIVAKFEVKERMFNCEICADSKPRKEAFRIKGCLHSYCSECMKTFVASKLQDGISIISCPVPSCSGVLEPEYCREILPSEVFVRWGNLLCESVILASQKFYCPFKDCSALLVDDGSEKVTMSECPTCFRLFCAQCKVAWHMGVECAEYQSLSKDEREKEDLMLRKLAKSKNWQRCPKCKYYVEKSEGCLYMKCRCGIAFCYSCGAINTDHRFHNCKKCGR